ncbi:MAG: hypothetical protein ACE5DK_12640 [Paracoccaceae bacterium]
MWRVIKLLVFLAAIGFLTITGYAVLGDLTPPSQEVTKQVTIELD